MGKPKPRIKFAQRQAIAETALQLLNDFCRIASPYAFQRFEGAFLASVQAYVEYTLRGEDRFASQHLKDVHTWIDRAKGMIDGDTLPTAPRDPRGLRE